jgi:CO/xanthine dehydrogenase Mo-binding subunit
VTALAGTAFKVELAQRTIIRILQTVSGVRPTGDNPDGERNPRVNGASELPPGSFAAQFAEVRVDPELGLLRLTRIVSALDAGRILDEKLARS